MHVVCHIITKLELGGAQEVALYTVSHLDRTKFRPVLITGPGGLLTEDAQRLPDAEVVIVPSLGRRIQVFGDLVTLGQLTILLRRLRPTIVHTHSSKAGILGRWAAWFARTPLIVHTIHGYGVTPAQPAWLQYLLRIVERVTGWITTHWIAVSQQDVLKGRTWGLFDGNVSLVRPGIDPSPFQKAVDHVEREKLRKEFGAGTGDRLVGTVACLKPQKAPEDFLAVAKRVCERHPQIKFVLVGDGELRPLIESRMARDGLIDRMYLAGWRRDIPAVMHALDAFLLTSHWEGLPRVLLEARTAGVPIVATNVGGAHEVVTNHRIGTLCEAGDVSGLAEALLGTLRRCGEGDHVGDDGDRTLPREFHIDEMVKRYERLYEEMLAQRRRNTKTSQTSPSPHSQPRRAAR